MGVPGCGIISAFAVGGIEPPRVCRLGATSTFNELFTKRALLHIVLMFAES